MEIKNSGYDKPTIIKDLRAFKSASERNDFEMSNVFANRIMSNAYLFNDKASALMGYCLKEISHDGMILNQIKDESTRDMCSTECAKLADSFIGQVEKGTIDLSGSWTQYSNFVLKSRFAFLNEDEKKAYQIADLGFTKAGLGKICDILHENKDYLKNPSNNLFKGVLNEVGRLVKSHGIDLSDLRASSLLTLIERLDEYVKVTAVSENDFQERMQKEIIPLVDEIIKTLSITDSFEKEERVYDILWKMINQWRLDFLLFLEPIKYDSIVQREQIGIKKQTKSRLVDALTKSIEKDLVEK